MGPQAAGVACGGLPGLLQGLGVAGGPYPRDKAAPSPTPPHPPAATTNLLVPLVVIELTHTHTHLPTPHTLPADLDQACLSLFLFGRAHCELWREPVGTLVAVLTPKVSRESRCLLLIGSRVEGWGGEGGHPGGCADTQGEQREPLPAADRVQDRKSVV